MAPKEKNMSQIGYEILVKGSNTDIRNLVKDFLATLPKIDRVSDSTLPVHHRRMDSFARLIDFPEDHVCTAVCFDGSKILIAANGNLGNTNYVNAEVVESLCAYLNVFESLADRADQRLALICYLADHKNITLAPEQIKAIAVSCLSNLDIIPIVAGEKEPDIKKIRKICLDLRKLEDSMLPGVTQFAPELITAIKAKEYAVLPIGIRGFHAEMKIVERLRTAPSGGRHYIGISKLCCAYCSKVVQMHGFVDEFETRGVHNFDRWMLADWMKEEGFLKAFLTDAIYVRYADLSPESKKEKFLLVLSVVFAISQKNLKFIFGDTQFEHVFSRFEFFDRKYRKTADTSISKPEATLRLIARATGGDGYESEDCEEREIPESFVDRVTTISSGLWADKILLQREKEFLTKTYLNE